MIEGLIFIFGLIIGSFLNVCITRLPKDESIAWPPSHCPACGVKLKEIDLIPILSFFMLKGKCRKCKKPISWRYPLVEALTGVLFILPFFHSIFLPLIGYWFFISLLIVVFFSDLEQLIVPDQVIGLGIPIGLLISWLDGRLMDGLFGLILGLILFLSIRVFGGLLFKREAMGWGDVKLAAMLGVFLGWYMLLVGIWFAFLIAAIVSLYLLIFKIKAFGEEIPFGPFMVIGALLALFFL